MSVVAPDDTQLEKATERNGTAHVRPHWTAPPPSRIYRASKATMDFGLALALLLASSPLVLLGMLIIKLTSRGPALYTQARVGKDGKPFVIFKLRTMAHDCENLTGARWSGPNDPRITRIGRWLRKTHLDELPQLWNVLLGDMSLIGPRPERPEFVPKLERAIPHYRGRLLVKPGLTGLAQIQLPPDTNLASVALKLTYDLYYVRCASVWFDCRILFGTAWKLTSMSFPVIRQLARLPAQECVEKEIKQSINHPSSEVRLRSENVT